MTWQFPLNKLFAPFRRNKVYASSNLYKTSLSTAGHIFKCVLCGRCGIVNYHPLSYTYKILKFLEGGNATGVRQSSMLGFYGERVCRRRNQTCSLWEAQQAHFLSIKLNQLISNQIKSDKAFSNFISLKADNAALAETCTS